MIFLFIIFLIFPVVWIVAECKSRPTWERITAGIVAMTVAAYVSCGTALLKPESENKYLHDSLPVIRKLAEQGRLDKLEKAFNDYDEDIRDDRGPYRASQDMWLELSSSQKGK